MILESVCVGAMQVNCYILAAEASGEAIIIDPGADAAKIKKVLAKHNLKATLIVNTHGHYDHIGADDKFLVPVYVHAQDLPLLKNAQLNLSGAFSLPYQVKSEIRTLQENEILACQGIRLKVLHIPGHTAGGIALVLVEPKENIVFSGDSLFCHGIGRTDLVGGDEHGLIRAIKEKLLSLPDATIVYPGHGPATNIKEEKLNNPFF